MQVQHVVAGVVVGMVEGDVADPDAHLLHDSDLSSRTEAWLDGAFQMSSFVSGAQGREHGSRTCDPHMSKRNSPERRMYQLADATIALITGGLSGGFALAGVGLSNWTSGRRERRVFGRETALELAGMERLVWGDSWVELKAHLQRQEDRLAVAGLPEALIDEFRAISMACWRNQHESVENSGGKDRGMSTRLVEARQAVHSAARAELLRRGSRRSRRSLRVDASTLVQAALPGPEKELFEP